MTRYHIEPQDVLFFRDGRDLHASESYTASSQFPPQPGTVYGALRSAILAAAGADFNAQVDHFGLGDDHTAIRVAGTRTRHGSLSIRHLGLHGAGGSPVFPVPSDVRSLKDAPDTYRILSPAQLPGNALTDSGATWFGGTVDTQPLKEASGYLTADPYADYLSGSLLPDGAVRSATEFWVRESRTHVSIDPSSGTAAESLLFAVPFVRFQHECGLLIEVDGDDGLLNDIEWLKLGGEGRAARIRKVEASARPQPTIPPKGRIRVILSATAPFANGWLPDGWTETGTFPFLGGTAEFRGCVLNRHTTVSGWDLAKHRPKPSRRAVPAGSVYYLDVSGIHPGLQSSIPSLCADPDDIRIGYGTYHIGNL